jgi:hypothetical protein
LRPPSAAAAGTRPLPEISVSPPPRILSPLPLTAGEASEALRELLAGGQWAAVWRLWRGCRHLLAQV